MKKLLLILAVIFFIAVTVTPEKSVVRTEQASAVANATYTSFI